MGLSSKAVWYGALFKIREWTQMYMARKVPMIVRKRVINYPISFYKWNLVII